MSTKPAFRAAAKRCFALLVAGLFLATSVIVAVPQRATADIAPDPADPVPPSANCEWYGSLQHDSLADVTWSYEESNSHQVTRDVTKFSSAVVDGQDCGAVWNATSEMHHISRSPNGCGGTIVTTNDQTFSGSGTGILSGGLTMLGLDGLVAGFSSETQQVQNGIIDQFDGGYCFGGGGSFTGPGQKAVFGLSSICPENATKPVGYFVDENAQAVAGTCVLDVTTTSEGGYVTRNLETFTWSFRKVACDFNIDSDGGGVSDCQEYENGTNPGDTADDGERDTDNDGVFDSTDNCDNAQNADQTDSDSDGMGNACDPDDDNDGLSDEDEGTKGTDPTNPDTDSDGDGDSTDPCPLDATNACEDSDDDGVKDDTDQCPGTPAGVVVDEVGCPENRKPVAVKDEITTQLNTPVSLNVLANDYDPDGDPISLVNCTNPTNGQVQPFVGGAVTYTPNHNFIGRDSFRCTITDNRGAKHSAAVVIKVEAGTIQLDMDINYVTYWHNRTPDGKKGSDTVVIDGTSSAWVTATPDQLGLIQSICIKPRWEVYLKQLVGSTVPVDWEEGGIDLNGVPNNFWNQPTDLSSGGSLLTSLGAACSAPGQPITTLSRPALRVSEDIYHFNLDRIRHDFEVTITLINGKQIKRNIHEVESAAKTTPLTKDLDAHKTISEIKL